MDSGTGNRSRKASKNEEEMEQWEDSVTSYSSVSSISSDSSEGHIILGKNIPRPTNYMSAPEPQRKKEPITMICPAGSSQPGLSSSSQHNQLVGMPGYDPNRIPASVFSSKASNPMEWSLASNESLFSIHMGNFSFSGDQALAALLRSNEKLKRDESVTQKTDTDPVVLPSAKESEGREKKPQTPKNLKQEEKSDSESDDEETKEEGKEVIKPDNNDEPENVAETIKQEEEEEEEEEEQQQEEESEIEEKEVDDEEEDEDDDGEVKEMKRTNPTHVAHSTSISCRSDTSNNSNCSFAFPVMENDDGVKTPSMQTKKEGSKQSQPQEGLLPQSRSQQPQTQTHPLPEPQPQGTQSKLEGQTQSLKTHRFRWFSCFYFPLRCC